MTCSERGHQERSAAGNVALPRQPRERLAPSSSPISVPGAGAGAGAASAQAFGGRLSGALRAVLHEAVPQAELGCAPVGTTSVRTAPDALSATGLSLATRLMISA